MNWSSGLSLDFWLRMGVALGCGAAIGLERQWRGKPTGMRTCMLICVGAMLFVRLGAEVGGVTGGASDPARVLGQVVTGIGFLGAGVILTRDGLVSGMTSAASIWLLAAVGSLVGLDHAGEAVGATVVAVAVLMGVSRLEAIFPVMQRGRHEDSADVAGDAREQEDLGGGWPRSGHPPKVKDRWR